MSVSLCACAMRMCKSLWQCACLHLCVCLCEWVKKKKNGSGVTSLNETSPWGRSSGLVKTQTRELLSLQRPLPPCIRLNRLPGRRPSRSWHGCEPKEREMVKRREGRRKVLTSSHLQHSPSMYHKSNLHLLTVFIIVHRGGGVKTATGAW